MINHCNEYSIQKKDSTKAIWIQETLTNSFLFTYLFLLPSYMIGYKIFSKQCIKLGYHSVWVWNGNSVWKKKEQCTALGLGICYCTANWRESSKSVDTFKRTPPELCFYGQFKVRLLIGRYPEQNWRRVRSRIRTYTPMQRPEVPTKRSRNLRLVPETTWPLWHQELYS